MDNFERIKQIMVGRAHPKVILGGACQGDDLKKLLQAAPQGDFFVFEPDPRNYVILQEKKWFPNVKLFNAALGEVDGFAPFHLSGGNYYDPKGSDWTQSSSLLRPKDHLKHHKWCHFNKTIQVAVRAVDSFCKEHALPLVDLLYLDVQGAERQVFTGALEQLRMAGIEYIFTEFAETEEYQGQIDLTAMIKLLPGTWEIVERWDLCKEQDTKKTYLGDVLLRRV
jgi:FkbM family methyltransferase